MTNTTKTTKAATLTQARRVASMRRELSEAVAWQREGKAGAGAMVRALKRDLGEQEARLADMTSPYPFRAATRS